MNTNDNLENEKQTLSEDQSVTNIESQPESTEVNSENVQDEINPESIEPKPVVEELPIDETTEPAAEAEATIETEPVVDETTEAIVKDEPVVVEETTEPVVEDELVIEEQQAKEEQVESETESDIDYDLEDANGDDLTYSVIGGDSAVFRVENSGKVIVKQAILDYETKTSYKLTVVVFDGLARDTATVTINVLNV